MMMLKEIKELETKIQLKLGKKIIYIRGWEHQMHLQIFKLQNFQKQTLKIMKNQTPDNCVANFVQKTYEILNNVQYAKIIHWSGNGKEFTIKDIEQFEETILPKFFRHRNINSFIRQLNMYGFHKSRKQPTKNIFSHPNFIKDKQELLQKVRRKIKAQEVFHNKMLMQMNQEQIKIQQNPTPTKSEAIPSISSLPIRSSIYLEKQYSPLKSLISKSYIIDKELYLNIDHVIHHQDFDRDNDEDNISIANQIQRERIAFNTRTQGISMVKTSNFLQDFGL